MLWRTTKLLIGLARRTTVLLVVLAMLALNVATLSFAGLNALVSGAIATGSGVQTVAKRQASKTATLQSDLAGARRTIASQADELTAARRVASRQADDLAAARRTVTRQADDLAAARRVRYRGRSSTVARAVSDTTDRIAKRTATAASRNLAATGAEAIPVWGVGVIAAATAYELKVACDTMRDLHELDLAFNPEAALDPERTHACGTEVPTSAELWAAIRASPTAAAEAAQDLFEDVSEADPAGWLIVMLGRAQPPEAAPEDAEPPRR